MPFVITGIIFVVTFHLRCISVIRSLCFRIFLAAFLITLQAPEIGTSVNSRFIITVCAVRLTVSGGSVGVQVMIPSSAGYLTLMTCFADFVTCWFDRSLCNCTPVSCICSSVIERTHCHVSLGIVLLALLGMLIQCGLLPCQIVGIIYYYYYYYYYCEELLYMGCVVN